jgi:hypothetical protein
MKSKAKTSSKYFEGGLKKTMQFTFKLFSKAEWRTNLFKMCTNNKTFEIKMTGSTYIVVNKTCKNLVLLSL